MKDKTIVHTVWIGCVLIVVLVVSNLPEKKPVPPSKGGNGQYVAENFEDQ